MIPEWLWNACTGGGVVLASVVKAVGQLVEFVFGV
jgi:hypothetical protein